MRGSAGGPAADQRTPATIPARSADEARNAARPPSIKTDPTKNTHSSPSPEEVETSSQAAVAIAAARQMARAVVQAALARVGSPSAAIAKPAATSSPNVSVRFRKESART